MALANAPEHGTERLAAIDHLGDELVQRHAGYAVTSSCRCNC
jgi:hypothetical protein